MSLHHVSVVNLHGDESNNLVPLYLGQLLSTDNSQPASSSFVPAAMAINALLESLVHMIDLSDRYIRQLEK